MTNHPNRNRLIVYVRESQGTLTRTSIGGMSKSSHMEHYRIGPVTSVETLVGWPETSVEWHGHVGYVAA